MSGFTPVNRPASPVQDTSQYKMPVPVADPNAPVAPFGPMAIVPGPTMGSPFPQRSPLMSGAATPRYGGSEASFGRRPSVGQVSDRSRGSGVAASGAVAPMADMGLGVRGVREIDDERARAQAKLDSVNRELAEQTAALTSVGLVRNLATALNSDVVKQFLAGLATSVRTGAAGIPELTDVQKRVLADSNYNGVVALELKFRPCDRCVRRLVQRPGHRCVSTPAGCQYCTALKKKCVFEVS